MASSLLALLDDIATLLDDVATLTQVAARKGVAIADDVSVMTKTAATKTTGVLGDDLALNAQQVSGVRAERELPVVWAVARGSLVNKAILVPAALLIGALVPWAITPLLMAGGAFLCFEGFEKLAHRFLHTPGEDADRHAGQARAVADPEVDLVVFERDKIRGAVRTDFILSAEIIAITLGTVAQADFAQQVVVLSLIALVMTVGVYGLVAGIVKLDDAGLYLARRPGGLAPALGRGILRAAPWLMRALSVVGTAAMFMVGGGILVHGWPWLHHGVEAATQRVAASPGGALLAALTPTALGALAGVIAGGLVLAGVTGVQRLRDRRA